jgi:hypothetical protein
MSLSDMLVLRDIALMEHVTEAHPDGIRHGVRQLAAMWSGECAAIKQCYDEAVTQGDRERDLGRAAIERCDKLKVRLSEALGLLGGLVGMCDDHKRSQGGIVDEARKLLKKDGA